ncbi:Flp pilus assembly protein CpaB [Pusillimonas noertemannii]|uniref:Flp pilus assembly protein CpaB n=1 Tax=Pusillimonas noertemannii TaxID=305977 RepID=UPI0002E0EC49|nr:Flp pilus assembly protein CpaB [Pusillimonas noertemannii]
MNPVLKSIAVLLVLLAAVLGVSAYRIASRPAPVPAAAPPPAATRIEPAPRDEHTVVLAARGMAAGTVLEPDDLRLEQWPVAPAQGFGRTEAVVGGVLRFDVAAGQALTDPMLVQGLATYLRHGERAINVALEDSAMLQHVQPGDMVDIFFTLGKDEETGSTQSRLLLPRARVLAYGAKSVDGPEPDTKAPSANRGAQAAPRSATLAVPLEQVNDLLLATRNGKLQLALRAPSDDARPDATLFPDTRPVLEGRAGLTTVQRQRLTLPENRAYAGDSLAQLAASETAAQRRGNPVPTTPRQSSRSVEILRGGQSERVHY